MDTDFNRAAVGAFVIILTTAIIIVSFWIAGGQQLKEYAQYQIFIDQGVEELVEKSPVKFNGVNVGFVDSMELNLSNPQQVRLVLKIETKIPINMGTIGSIRSQGLTGVTYVSLEAQNTVTTPIQKLPNEPYPIIRSAPSAQGNYYTVLKDVTEKIEKVSDNFNKVFSETNQVNLEKIMKNLVVTTDMLNKNTESIDASLKSAQNMLANTEKISTRFPDTFNRLDRTLTNADEAAIRLKNMGHHANNVMTTSQRSIEEVEYKILPNVNLVMEKLNRIMSNIEQVSDDLRVNPTVLIRGKAASRPGPGE
jgi:phospholipid/cholesterol/gamma-HCH transport system substrate-binding protein